VCWPRGNSEPGVGHHPERQKQATKGKLQGGTFGLRMYKHQRISTSIMMNLQIAKWGNSLAVRIPADYVRQIGVKEGDQLVAHFGADGALNLSPPSRWSRKTFAQELARSATTLPMGTSVIEQLRQEARY
jgi:antitoxin MazE